MHGYLDDRFQILELGAWICFLETYRYLDARTKRDILTKSPVVVQEQRRLFTLGQRTASHVPHVDDSNDSTFIADQFTNFLLKAA